MEITNKLQPDLFLVMSEAELRSAAHYASECISGIKKEACIYENLHDTEGQYRLTINGQDVAQYIIDEDDRHTAMFPMFPFYVVIKTQDNDHIVMAISPTLWPESHDINMIIAILSEYGFEVEDFIARTKTTKENNLLSEGSSYYKSEAEYAKRNPIISPWTIRDSDTLKGALTPGEEGAIPSLETVERIDLVTGSNIQIHFHACRQYYNIGPAKHPIDSSLTTYNFPNAIIIYTNDGNKTLIYVGPKVSIEDITRTISECGLQKFTSIDPFDEERISDFIHALLLPPRESKIKV